MAIDVARTRRETPGADSVLHFNNAGAALMPSPVIDAVQNHIALEAVIGGYEAEARKQAAIAQTYSACARLVGGEADEIALVENATRAWDMAFYALAAGFATGDRILTAEAEYASNVIAYLQVAQRTGVTIEPVPNDVDGALNVEALAAMIDDRVKLIAVTHVPTNGGLVNPAAEIGSIARAAGIPYLLDACQSAGQLPLDVGAIGCDVLTATGRKYVRGPRGTGFLWVRRDLIETLEPPFLDLHAAEWTGRDRYTVRADAKRFETWEGNVAAKIGLGVAVGYALDWGLDAIAERIGALADCLRIGLEKLPEVTVRDLGRQRCGVVSFTTKNRDSASIHDALAARGINVSVSPRCYTRYDMDARGLESLVHASVHYYNTEDEIDRFCAAVEEIA